MVQTCPGSGHFPLTGVNSDGESLAYRVDWVSVLRWHATGEDHMSRDDNVVPINIRLLAVQQLFNSLDPSPFHDKDLDSDAHEYIFGSANEFSLQKAMKLVIEIPNRELEKIDANTLRDAIHNYFSYRAAESHRKIRFLLREGRTALFIGLVFLIACTSLRHVAVRLFDATIAGPVSEGLLILGWVAMWRPMQIFLYDWWPIRHAARIYAKLGRMPVEVNGFD